MPSWQDVSDPRGKNMSFFFTCQRSNFGANESRVLLWLDSWTSHHPHPSHVQFHAEFLYHCSVPSINRVFKHEPGLT